MRRYIVNHPVVEPLTLTEIKRWLRVDHADDDQLISGLVRAARERVEARTGRALLAQTWRIVMDQWPVDGQVALPIMPVISVAAVRVADAAGVFNVIAPAVYKLDTRLDPAVLSMSQVVAPGRLRGGIEIDVIAGYGVTPNDCPATLRQAMQLMIGEVYTRRGPDQNILQKASTSTEVENLLAPYCSIRLGRMALGANSTGVNS